MLTASDVSRIKKKITSVLKKYASVAPARTTALLPMKSLQGKLYEADVLAHVCEMLVTKEHCVIKLQGGSTLVLKQKGSAIDRKYPFFKVVKGGNIFAEIFTDVYFATLSHHMKGSPLKKTYGDYHELDIVLLQPNLSGYPKPGNIILAIECKNTSVKKSIIREVLGFRRELSYWCRHSQPTKFSTWPSNTIHAHPNSVHMFYCSDNRILRYSSNCLSFGILLKLYKM